MIRNRQRIKILKSLRNSGFKGNYIQELRKLAEGGFSPDNPPTQAVDNTYVSRPIRNYDLSQVNLPPLETLAIPEKVDIIKQSPDFQIRKAEIEAKADLEMKPQKKTFDLANVSGIQSFLKTKGYDIGKYGIDNKLGKDTVSAMQKYLKNNGYYIGQDKYANKGVDGILGKVTMAALEQFNTDQTSGRKSIYHSKYSDEEGFLGACDEKQCAEFSQKEYIRNTSLTEDELVNKIGFTGDAWNIEQNLISKGGQPIYSRDKKINNLDNIRPGDHVSIYTGGLSNFQMQAGEGKPTHSAIVDSNIKYDDGGRPYVYLVHNVHKLNLIKGYEGRMFRSKMFLDNLSLSNFPQYKPTAVVSPNLSNSKEKPLVKPDLDLKIESTVADNPYRLKAIEGLNKEDFRQRSMTDFNLNNKEYMSLAIAVLGLIDQESGFGEKGKIPGIDNKLELAGKETTAKIIKAFTSDEASLGWARIKYNTNFKDIDRRLKTDYGLTKSKLSVTRDKGDNSARTAFLIVTKYYNQLKQKSGISSPEEALYLAIQKFNKYNLGRSYGLEGKSAYEYAKEGNLSYVNKILDYSRKYQIKDNSGTVYRTLTDSLNQDDNILINQLSRE